MKQLDFFSTKQDHTKTPKKKDEWHLFVDGASRNNPGNSGAGIYVQKNKKPVGRYGFFLGKKTNNQAEYLALLIGVILVQKEMAITDTLHIVSDSELLVQQLNGIYKVKNTELKKMHAALFSMLVLTHYTVCHVLRDKNKVADSLANKGIDEKIMLPVDIVESLSRHGIVI